jgi:hypothetical protein
MSNGKGSARRGLDPESSRRYHDGWEAIFGQGGATKPRKRRAKATDCRKPYPSWVCADCCTKAGGKHRRADGISTWHTGDCEVCGITQWVTQPRDYGYPKFK